MSQEIANYLKYTNVQMAAEATDLDRVLRGEVSLKEALVLGNKRASMFPETLAASFVNEGWQLVAHQKNTTTGFSGSLFKNGKTGELVMSFSVTRSQNGRREFLACEA